MGGLGPGVVVLVRFPFSDLSSSKLRPALVLAPAGGTDWVLCQITSNPYGDPAAQPLEAGSFLEGGLHRQSFARPGKLFTANESIVVRHSGILSVTAHRRIVDAVIRLLEGAVVAEALACVTLLVREYDEAIEFFTKAMGFQRIADSALPDGKRWVVVAPSGIKGMQLLLARASTPAQERVIGHQAGDGVGFFLHTDDFMETYRGMSVRGVEFLETPRSEPYGTVAVFVDLYGNRWDLIEPRRKPA